MPSTIWNEQRTSFRGLSSDETVDGSKLSPFGPDVDEAIRQHAIEEYPKECCGVVANGVYHRAINYHGTPEKDFLIAESFLQTFASVQAIAHSHPYVRPFPSSYDMSQQMLMDIPWALVSVDVDSEGKPFCKDLFWWGDDLQLPLLNRAFRPGAQDCYALVRAYYLQVLEIDLPDFPRDDQWWTRVPGEPTKNLFAEGFESAGFVAVDAKDIHVHDVFGVPYMQSIINHCGVFIEGDRVLHHFAGRLSNTEPAYKWTRRAKEAGLILRHRSQL